MNSHNYILNVKLKELNMIERHKSIVKTIKEILLIKESIEFSGIFKLTNEYKAFISSEKKIQEFLENLREFFSCISNDIINAKKNLRKVKDRQFKIIENFFKSNGNLDEKQKQEIDICFSLLSDGIKDSENVINAIRNLEKYDGKSFGFLGKIIQFESFFRKSAEDQKNSIEEIKKTIENLEENRVTNTALLTLILSVGTSMLLLLKSIYTYNYSFLIFRIILILI